MSTLSWFVPRPTAIARGIAFVAAPLITAWFALGRLFGWLPRPAAPHARSRAAEAAQVRELAHSVRVRDPGFAADLYAAALRHESLPH